MNENNMNENRSNKQLFDVKEQILVATEKLMKEKGIKNTTLKDIAEKSNISRGTLYYYYSAKDDIIYDIADRNLNETTKEILLWIKEMNDEKTGQEILENLFNKVLEAETRAKLHLYLLNEATTTNQKLIDKINSRYLEWYEQIKFGIDKFIIENQDDKKALSHLILASLDGLMIQKMAGVEDLPVSDIVKIIMNSIK